MSRLVLALNPHPLQSMHSAIVSAPVQVEAEILTSPRPMSKAPSSPYVLTDSQISLFCNLRSKLIRISAEVYYLFDSCIDKHLYTQ
jgi:hypothetical protein